MGDENGFWLCRAVLNTAQMFGFEGPHIDQVRPLAEGEMVGALRVIHTPGHTPGSISLWDEQDKAIFCGDNLLYAVGAVRLGLPWFTLDGSQQKTSLERYVDLPAQLLLSGHGPVYQGDVASAVKRML